ncbi:MMPL family transporter [Phytoactinopolyspora halotolerans]|uniref:MMPL family transporter n=1 Tax=Phytoactinopolyspora halotolerans TaxID=1981512 RepID=A0A6L9S656_9ACTN|nr:MMPL family transporter [Phytoactinopolyspora halotolerans]
MATFLYRLGRTSYRRRGIVALTWLVLFVLAGVGASTLSGDTNDSFEIPGTESQEAFDLLEERFPEMPDSDNTAARVVFAAPEGETLTDPENQAVVDDVVAALSQAPQVAAVADPFEAGTVAEGNDIAYADVDYGVEWGDLSEESKEALKDIAQDGRDAGLTVELSGEAVEEWEAESMSSELIGIAVAAVVLVITFGSLTAAGLPLLNAIIGVGIAISAITAATGFIDMGADTSILATMLGLAVAIDYALFIVSRYRHELAMGREGSEAAGRALGTAGSAVVFAGLTVMIALSGLFVVGIPMLTEMGLAAAFAVGIAVLIALSLLPAMLGFAKHRVLGGRIPGLRARDPESDDTGGKPSAGRRWATFVTRRPKAVAAVAVVAMIGIAAPVMDMRLGLPGEESMSEDTTQRQAYDLVSEGFGEGYNAQLTAIVDASGSDNPQGAFDQAVESLSGLGNVVAVSEPFPNEAGDTAILSIIPENGPSSAETEDLVSDARDLSDQLASDTGATLSVTGNTAVVIDFNQKIADAMAPYLAIVVGLSFILLMLVFRSILVPLKAGLGFLVTMGATFGLLVAVFQWGWFGIAENTGPIISMLPIFLIGVVFGLAMDYEVFLVTRMREEYVHGAAPTQSVVTGFQHGSRVVTAAAIIMMSVFGAFMLGGEDFIMQVGMALAAAVAFDAFVVRMTIVPAILTLLGRRAWWLPRWLDRLLPNVDVEGEKLAKYLNEDGRKDREPAAVGS